ncbi:MAG: YihY/virulence factor BrkB family protein [bacterium]|nr:YihY/virulence factor BrkB family protein [bacterium]
MAKFISNVKKVFEFVTKRLWKVRISKLKKGEGFLIRQLRVFVLAFKGFIDDNCLTSATALTFYTLFSIVPILALAFAISKGFGYEKNLQEQILNQYRQYEDILNSAFVYANSLLSNTKGGVIAGFGVVLLLWSIMSLLMNIETIFNHIWEVRKGRTVVRILTDYLTIMLIGPLMLIVSGGLSVLVQSELARFYMLGFVSTFIIKTFAYLILALLFTFLYVAMPNVKVKFSSAFIAGLVAAFLFQVLGWVYVNFQIGANRMNAIYGGFAALPLFLIWVQYSWYVVLLGAELAYANENVDHYELEEDIKNLSNRYKKVLALMIANLIAKRFYKGEKPLNATEISSQLDLPSRLTRILLNEFVQTGILAEVKTEKDKEIVYQPGITESKLTVKFLIDAIDRKGVNSIPINDSSELIHITKLMHEMDKLLENDLGSMNIKDLVK